MQDYLLLAGKQIAQVASWALVNWGCVACLGGDVCLLGKVAAEPGSGPIRSSSHTRYTSFGHASNRKMLLTDIEAAVSRLRERGARFRSDVITGVGGKQVLVEDPAGNPVELFEPTIPEAQLSSTD